VNTLVSLAPPVNIRRRINRFVYPGLPLLLKVSSRDVIG
jgi:hypothetical protein